VGNGVVDVQNIEAVLLGDLRHARGKGQAVGRVLEERIVGDLHFVIEDVGALAEADGVRVGDEMDLVAAVGQLQSELRGDDAAAAVGGVTSDPDSHEARLAVR